MYYGNTLQVIDEILLEVNQPLHILPPVRTEARQDYEQTPQLLAEEFEFKGFRKFKKFKVVVASDRLLTNGKNNQGILVVDNTSSGENNPINP